MYCILIFLAGFQNFVVYVIVLESRSIAILCFINLPDNIPCLSICLLGFGRCLVYRKQTCTLKRYANQVCYCRQSISSRCCFMILLSSTVITDNLPLSMYLAAMGSNSYHKSQWHICTLVQIHTIYTGTVTW